MTNAEYADKAPDGDVPGDDQAGRKRETLKRLERGKSEVLRLIRENDGIYPRNGGRLSQAELCRLAGINQTLLGQPAHRNTTRLELNAWLRNLANSSVKGKRRVRADITAKVSAWQVQYNGLHDSFAIVELEKIALEARLEAKDIEIYALNAQLEAKNAEIGALKAQLAAKNEKEDPPRN